MDSINTRVKELRKTLGISAQRFADAVAVTRPAISHIESGKNNVSDQMLKAICREFNVNEEWLRTGEGDVFKENADISFDDLIATQEIDPLESQILKAYFSLDKDIRKTLIETFKRSLRAK